MNRRFLSSPPSCPLALLIVIACLQSATVGLLAQDGLNKGQLHFFEMKIRPVLIEHCYDCHSAESDQPEGNLLLDSADGLRRGGESGPAIVPGRPGSSLLLLAMKHEDPVLSMPPTEYGDRLPDGVIADFERWILAGAPDPRAEDSIVAHENADSESWWAWKTPTREPVPAVDNTGWSKNDVDRFVLAKLEDARLSPSEPADRLSLVRRLAFDLTGLPPSADDLQTFALDSKPKPIEELIDQYLESEQFGERFGRLWLDVARYAESTGKDVNVAYPYAWRYRDYVIDALNADKPINRFFTEQIAGDLLASRTARERGEQTIATGFLAIGPKSINEMNPRQFATDLIDEQIDAFSQAFLGVTIACARCHDHKFDPISQQDYTALAGIFLSTKTHFGTIGGVAGRNRSSLVDLPEEFRAEGEAKRSLSSTQLARLRERVDKLEEDRRELIRKRVADEADESDRRQILRVSQQLNQLQIQLDSVDGDGRALPKAMGVADKPEMSARSDRLHEFLRSRRPRRPRRGSMLDLNPSMQSQGIAALGRRASDLQYIADSPLFIRGEIDKPGEIIPRGLPEFLASGYVGEIPDDQSGRLQLAAWIVSDRNPLTARVFVNRVWSWMFGQGIVASVDNFGTSGELPSHPSLLDHLALEFIQSGWSLKTLVRKIVTSNSYQQASAFREEAYRVDPDNRLLWRANRRPLDAESMRDGLLAVSGNLVAERPVGSLVYENGDGLIGGSRRSALSEAAITSADIPVRSVYLPVPRNVLPDALQLFDFPDNSAVHGSRDLTIVPSQALYWMNSPQVEAHCQKVAENTLREHVPTMFNKFESGRSKPVRAWVTRRFPGRFWDKAPQRRGSDPEPVEITHAQIEMMFSDLCFQILSRPPLEAEIEAVRDFVRQAEDAAQPPEAIWTSVTRSLFSSADYRFLR